MVEADAFILIGGRSSRLGVDKAFVEVGGETLTARAISNVRRGLSPDRITLVARSSTQFAIEAIAADVPFIFDLYEHRGPIGGLHAALAHAKTPWIFILACDYPFVSPKLIRILADEVSDDFGTVVAEQKDGRLQPLCGFYRVQSALAVVEEILERPRAAPPMHEVVEGLDPRVIKFEEYAGLPGAEDFFYNINTADNLRHANEIAFLPPRKE